MYTPKPIETSRIALSPALMDLTEFLARNNHDIWALQRMGEGWTYGLERDDKNKRHPDLVPYEELPDSEKEYDRKTAMEVLKVILSLGYRIEKWKK
jgi:hypothetical protein